MPFDTPEAKGLLRAYSILDVKAVRDPEQRSIEGMASTPTADRVGDIVDPMGAIFKTPMPLLWQHEHEQPVGWVEFAKPTRKGIPFKARIATPKDDWPQHLKDRVNEAWVSVRDKLVAAVSIGFRSIDTSRLENGGLHFNEWEWIELSLVTVPANAEATITTVKSIDREIRAALGTSDSAGRSKPARVGAPHKKRSVRGDSQMTTISERISALEAEEANLKAQLKKFDVEDMDEADEERFDEIEADLAATRKKLNRLRVQEELTVEKTAKPVGEAKSAKDASEARSRAPYMHNTVKGPNANIPAGINFARSVICLANAQGNKEYAADLAAKYYSDDARIAHFLRLTPEMKAAVPAAFTGDSSGWAETIAEAQTIGTQFIDYLRPMTIVDRLDGFRRVGFNEKVPRMTTGQSGYWVGEGKPTPMTSGVFDLVTMGKTKVGSISAMTKEQLRFSNTNAEARVRDDLAKGLVAKLDSTFIGTAAAVAGVSPAGLLNGVSAQTSAGNTADDVREDLALLYKLFSAAEIDLEGISFVTTGRLKKAISLMRSSLGIAEFPDAANTLDGQPFFGSNHCGGGDVVAISTQDILLADDGEVDISMSDQASVEMLDGSLTQDATAGTGASLVNLWQNGLVAIKVERFINWQKARTAAVQLIGDATYLGVATA